MPRLVDLGGTGSAYLDQHVANPVRWWTWGADAFAEARRLDRPVFLSVGYAACHWCHVMAHESFEDESVAAALNDSFVSIKVDREQRPDVDAAYMAATQLLTGHGGWPMSVFLTPEGDPFYAGTYFPPGDRPGAVGFPRILAAMADAWANRRDAVVAQAEELRAATAREVAVVDHLAPAPAGWDLARARQALRNDLVERCDSRGGFGPAPKFPRADYVTALLDATDDLSRDAVTRTLEAMARGGLYDHLGGGFARYSVDAEWRVPHFEKMLYDQALLARCYLVADRSRGGATPWRDVALGAIDFVRLSLKVAAGYASSLDADAAGVEGSHVTWTPEEARACLDAAGLGDAADAALARWSLDGAPDLDGRHVPRLRDGEPFATPRELVGARNALIEARAARPQPGRDEKVVLEWNAMFASALLSTRDPAYEAEGLALLTSLATTHRAPDGWWRTERPGARATAHDLAWLVDAHVDAFEVTGEDAWIERAHEVAAELLARHWEGPVPSASAPERGGGLLTSSSLVADLALRAKDVFDGATPSAHGVATRALARLALVGGDEDAMAVARRLVDLGATLVSAHPSAVPVLVDAARYVLGGVEVVVPGDGGALRDHVRSTFVARSVLVTGTGSSPLLAGRHAGHVYVCRGGVCQLPVTSADGFDAQVAALD